MHKSFGLRSLQNSLIKYMCVENCSQQSGFSSQVVILRMHDDVLIEFLGPHREQAQRQQCVGCEFSSWINLCMDVELSQ